MKSKKQKEVKPFDTWWCETCKTNELTKAEMAAHLKDSHGLDVKGLKCNKSMLMHMDGDTWHQSSYKITVQSGDKTIELRNEVLANRAKDDPFRYM